MVTQAIDERRKEFWRLYGTAKAQRASGLLNEADGTFQQAEPLSDVVEWADFYNDWADVAAQQNRYEEAIARYEHALMKEADNPSACYRKALLLEKLGDSGAARQCWVRAASLGWWRSGSTRLFAVLLHAVTVSALAPMAISPCVIGARRRWRLGATKLRLRPPPSCA